MNKLIKHFVLLLGGANQGNPGGGFNGLLMEDGYSAVLREDGTSDVLLES